MDENTKELLTGMDRLCSYMGNNLKKLDSIESMVGIQNEGGYAINQRIEKLETITETIIIAFGTKLEVGSSSKNPPPTIMCVPKSLKAAVPKKSLPVKGTEKGDLKLITHLMEAPTFELLDNPLCDRSIIIG